MLTEDTRWLVYDRREAMASTPGTHALVIGVSTYSHIQDGTTAARLLQTAGSEQLSTAARSAFIFHNWLLDNADQLVKPLKSIRLLLAPSDAEADEIKPSELYCTDCGTEDVSSALYDWRDDASRDPSGATIFYFCGHGFDLGSSNPYIALGDFGASRRTALAGAIAVDHLIRGLAPSRQLPEIARTQLYFFDAGRRHISWDFEPAPSPAIFDLALPLLDDRQMAVCHAALEGQKAWAVLQGITFFLAGLMRCLRGQAAVSIPSGQQTSWQITVSSLAQALPEVVQTVAEQAGVPEPQRVTVIVRLSTDTVLVRLAQAPIVPVVVQFDPPQAAEKAEIAVRDNNGQPVEISARLLEPGRREFVLPAGPYVVSVDFHDAEENSRQFIAIVTPPRVVWEVTAQLQ